MTARVYGLYDTQDQTKRIRYVGQTRKTLEQRLSLHHKATRYATGTEPVLAWMRELGRDRIGIALLEECFEEDRLARERHWIDELGTLVAEDGFNLSRRGRWKMPEYRKKLVGDSVRLAYQQPEHSAAITAHHRRRMQDPRQQEIARKTLTAASPKANHVRWHVNRGKTNPECPYCLES